MSKNAFLGIGVVIVILVGGAFIAGSGSPSSTDGGDTNNTDVAVGGDSNTIPNVVLQTAGGESVSLLASLDKPSVLNVWASWCPFCVNELPDFEEFASEHVGEFDVFVINRGESVSKGESYLDDLGLANGALKVLYDPSENFYRGIGGFAMPETVFVDAQGKILHHKRGPLTKEAIDELVVSLGL